MKKIYSFLLFCFFVSFAEAQTVTCDSIIQTSTCAGGNVIIPFTVSGNFNFGNTFTAQLSNNFGSFANPVNIGSIFWFTSGVIFATIPQNTNFGFLYRVRIIASNPSDTSNISPNTLIVTQVAQLNTIIATPGDTACVGDTISLFAVNPAASYSWSTGDTTQTIQVTQSGIYTVTTTDFLTCESSVSDTIAFVICSGINEQQTEPEISLYPNPITTGGAGEQLTLKLPKNNSGDLTIRIINQLGQTVFIQKQNNSATGVYTVDVSGLSAGIYFLQAAHADFQKSQKFMVRQ